MWDLSDAILAVLAIMGIVVGHTNQQYDVWSCPPKKKKNRGNIEMHSSLTEMEMM